MIRGPRRPLGADGGAADVLERARERRARRHEFLRRESGAVDLLGQELPEEDARLEAEGLRLAVERRELEAAAALARRQRDLDDEEAKASLGASVAARSQAVEEARGADRRRGAAEEQARELLAWCRSLEEQAELREAALASMEVGSGDPAELRKREEALVLEAAERARELEQLETRERLVTQAENDVAARETRVLEEVCRRVATTRQGLEREFEGKLGMIRVEAEGRTAALRAQRDEATRRADASRAALEAAQKELAASQAEVLRLCQRMEEAVAIKRQNANEIRQRQVLEHVHGRMLTTIRERANIALGNICEAAVGEPHTINYAGNLQFFTAVVTQLEARSVRADRLVEERSRALLGRAFSRVFSHLRNMDPHFDFDAAIAPVPQAIRGDLADWVENNVDALVRAFASDDDDVIVAANEGGVVDDPDAAGGDAGSEGEFSDASDGSGGAPEDVLGDLSDRVCTAPVFFTLHEQNSGSWPDG